jgi:heme/copper-type cytochrome/quinol oxidase subunit 4
VYPLVAFGFTFFAIAIFWFAHYRLFQRYFVPRRSTVVLNFVILAALVWMIYQLQLYVHFATNPAEHGVASASYLFTFGAVYALLAALYALCLRIRWPHLDPRERVEGIGPTGRLAALGLGTLIAEVLATAFHAAPETGFVGTMGGLALWAAVWPLLRKRIA